MIKILPVQKIY